MRKFYCLMSAIGAVLNTWSVIVDVSLLGITWHTFLSATFAVIGFFLYGYYREETENAISDK